jgi:hypothetical protein
LRRKARRKRQLAETADDVLPLRVRKHRQRFDESTEEDLELRLFDLAAILAATDNFAEKSKIGEGGFGLVYLVRSMIIVHS